MSVNLPQQLPQKRRWILDDFEQARDHEPLIHRRALVPMVSYAREYNALNLLFEGVQLDAEEFERVEVLSWAQFLIVTQNFFLRFGQRDEVLFGMCRQQTNLPGYEIASTFGGLFASPRLLYRAAAKWFSPLTFPCVYPNTLDEPKEGCYHLEIKLKPGFTPSANFFVFNRAMIATSTSMLGLGDAVVTMTLRDPLLATFEIVPPTSRTLLARLRRAVDMWLRGSSSMVSHLDAQFKALQHTNQRLQAKIQELEFIQNELEDTRAQHLRAINGTREGIWELSLEYGILEVSPRWSEIMYGMTYTEPQPVLTFDDWRAMVHREDLDAFDMSFEAHLGDDTDSWVHTFRLQDPQSHEARWVRVRARTSLVRGDDNPRYLSGSIADITLAERTRQDLPMLLQESPYPLCVTSSAGQIMFVNKAFYVMLEREPDSLNAHHITAFMDERCWREISAQLTTQYMVQAEQRWAMPEPGQDKEISLKAKRITLLNGPCVLWHAEDLAARRAEQAHHMQMDRILSMGTMAASIGHEINNPMAFLQSNLEFAISLMPMLEDGGAQSAEIRDDLGISLQEALEGAQRVVKIVRNLRSFSQHSRQDRSHPQVVTLESLVAPALSMVRAELSQYARLDIETSLDWESACVRLDPSRVVQVLTNLLINAAHAVESATGDRTGSRHLVSLSVDVDPAETDTLVCAIRDTGIGIASADLERIFTPFFTSKAQGKGTGLGLYICKMLMEEMGGSIEVESQPGHGTCFTLRFPCAMVEPTSPTPIEPEPAAEISFQGAMNKPQLLIIDDERPLLSTFSRKLATHFDVRTCEGGSLALQDILKGYQPQVILCDVIMPEMNGVELFDSLREISPELCERVVFMSGGSSHELQAQIRERGASLLAKPLEQPELLRIVDGLLRQDRPEVK
jgi:signal transduction histidine kinase/CheY-like chemotaxis protein